MSGAIPWAKTFTMMGGKPGIGKGFYDYFVTTPVSFLAGSQLGGLTNALVEDQLARFRSAALEALSIYNLPLFFFRTIEHGRWASVKSARTYINEAAAEEAALASTEKGRLRLKDGVALCRPLLRRTFVV